MRTFTDSHSIITITPDYVFFNFRGRGCYRVNDFRPEGGEEEMALHGRHTRQTTPTIDMEQNSSTYFKEIHTQ